ncbi:MAG: hypothetical protein GXY36_04100 [Chloroflexi bacterium]|jgi:hypothetical protein|nr:hypothetical protein [Chloroflexota bacterium]
MKLSSRAYNLYEAFAKPGCPVCRLAVDSVHHYLDSVIYEYVTKPHTHEGLRAARGFCQQHAWHVIAEINASALGVAVLYEGLFRTLLNEMGGESKLGAKRQIAQALNALKPQAPCPACTHQATVEDHLLRNLIDHIDQDEFADAFRRSEGLCLPHLRLALDRRADTDKQARLLSLEQAIWQQLQVDLDEFIRLHDYRFEREDMGVAGTSPRRAIEQSVGARDLRH